MTTKKYIESFFKDGQYNYEAFLEQFGNEFNTRLQNMIQFNRDIDAQFTYQKFQHLVKEMNNKFKSIGNKIPGQGLKEGLFGAFFSKYVIPQRAELFPDIHKEVSKRREEYLAKESSPIDHIESASFVPIKI